MHIGGSIHSSKSVAIIFGVGLGIYLIYLHRYANNQGEISQTHRCLYQKELTATSTQPPCAQFPGLIDMNVTDTYWQVVTTTNGTFYLFNAYYDSRDALGNVTLVRILALINRLEPVTVKTHCQLWYEDEGEAVLSEVIEYRALWPSYWGQNKKGATPFLVSCKNPKGKVPKFVSLVEGECGKANNVMEVKNKRPTRDQRKLFVVSVKGVDFDDDVSILLIEWCEILKLLGVDKVEVFIVRAHANVVRVLQYYQNEGFVTIKFLKYPRDLPNERGKSWHQWSQNDLIPYHDSFYENLYLYEYLVPMDIDEFIMPIRPEDRTWKDLLQRSIERSKIANMEFDSFATINRYFLLKSVHENETIEGIPRQLRFLSSVYRAANFTPNGGNAKSFMRMDRVLNVHNHFPLSCINGQSCRKFTVDLADGQLSHYRTDCDNPECKESKANPTKDISLWKFKDEILSAVAGHIRAMNIFKSNLEGDAISLK
jgi:hypothetical protein